MKEIFTRIEGREWFHSKIIGTEIYKLRERTLYKIVYENGKGAVVTDHLSLADLLANKSWCKAVWPQATERTGDWRHESSSAFDILQQEGEEAAIKYIKETMI